MRIDKYLSENGLSKSRTHAKELVENGFVLCNGKVITKASAEIGGNDIITLSGDTCPYVSRGGFKLAGALKSFNIDVRGMIALDVGASTGGFTDVLLQNGTSKVISVDSGHGQLDKKLLSDERVTSMEGYNARALNRNDIGLSVDIAVCDVSFISQTYVHSGIFDCLSENGIYIGLVKPQFELTKEALSKGGIVKKESDRFSACERVYASLVSVGFSVTGFDISPIEGGDGNIEFLILAKKSNEKSITLEKIRGIVFEKSRGTSEK